jgi:hypothetical protein
MSFPSEEAMQEWLSSRLKEVDGLGEIVLNPEIVEAVDTDSPQVRSIRESFRYSLQGLWITEVITENENISLSHGEILKPDFVLYALETQSLLIVELKNIAGPTRQAATEASAYAGELRSHLPFLADGDVINVIISPVWPALLRHHVAHDILWIGRKILCLEPVELWGLHALKVVDPAVFTDDASAAVSAEELGGFQLCLYDDGLYGGASRDRFDHAVPQMRAALQMMAARGNALRSHGFAFLWKDNWTASLAPFSITLVHAAPFKGVGRFLLTLPEGSEPASMQMKLLKLVREFDPGGQSQTLQEISDVADQALSRILKPRPEGFTHWGQLRREIEDVRSQLLAFAGWGRFGDRFSERLTALYAAGDFDAKHDDPDLGLAVVAELVTGTVPPDPAYMVFEDDLPEGLDEKDDFGFGD